MFLLPTQGFQGEGLYITPQGTSGKYLVGSRAGSETEELVLGLGSFLSPLLKPQKQREGGS